jgi:hypothetical protein
MNEAKPVELLRDRRGIYGIGVSDAYDIEAQAWACGIDETHNRSRDWLAPSPRGHARTKPCRCGPSRSSALNGMRPSRPT